MGGIKIIFKVPHQQVFDYREGQHEKNEMENEISHVGIDLTTETIRKGSPIHGGLQNPGTCYRQIKDWDEDVMVLKKINKEWGRINGLI